MTALAPWCCGMHVQVPARAAHLPAHCGAQPHIKAVSSTTVMPAITRRSMVFQLTGLAMLASARRAHANETTFFPADLQTQLPRGYSEATRKLITALQDTLHADMDGASENEVRRKADPAKGRVKEWITRWRDDVAVRGTDSHREVTDCLQALGAFYQQRGQRARMSRDAGNDLLGRLATAEAALPASDKKK